MANVSFKNQQNSFWIWFSREKKSPNTFQSFYGKNGQHLLEKKPLELYESFLLKTFPPEPLMTWNMKVSFMNVLIISFVFTR